MTRLTDTDHARLPLGKRGAFEGVARWPWMASGMGTDDARTPPTNQPRHQAQRWVEKVGRSITNSETPQCLEIRGHAEAITDPEDSAATVPGAIIRIHPRRIISFGIDPEHLSLGKRNVTNAPS